MANPQPDIQSILAALGMSEQLILHNLRLLTCLHSVAAADRDPNPDTTRRSQPGIPSPACVGATCGHIPAAPSKLQQLWRT